jgi:hypothetical protein
MRVSPPNVKIYETVFETRALLIFLLRQPFTVITNLWLLLFSKQVAFLLKMHCNLP